MEHGKYLLLCDEIARASAKEGNTPFGAVLVDGKGNVLLEQGNLEGTLEECTAHAELKVAEKASKEFPKEKLRECTLYTTVEPCAMCAGAIYWSGIGKMVYGVSERDLLALTKGNSVNPTLDLPSREVFARGQYEVKVEGPIEECKDELLEIHKTYWRENK